VADERVAVDALISHHMNPFRSGVARFNQILADRLGVALLHVGDPAAAECICPLFSLKVGELDPPAAEHLAALIAPDGECGRWCAFLHDFAGLPLEHRLATGAEQVWCGNHEVLTNVRRVGGRAEVLWAPGLVSDLRRYEPSALSVFSFGMAHKIQTDMFERLKQLLDVTGQSYALYLSAANHETAAIEDAQVVFQEMQRIFRSRLYFVGNLSDVAVFNHLLEATFFAAFFPAGVRANNTSVASAMEHGAVVITNLDEHSPPYLAHMDNMIDINQADDLPRDPLVLRRLSVRAMETAREHRWDDLVAAIRNSDGP
jgi:hypothetical protein